MTEENLLQLKINKAKTELSPETLRAIDAVPWQAEILKLRETKGYSFEQLDNLETETELLLCGLLSPEEYSRELEKRMRIEKEEAISLVEEMNKRVFYKIREELIKITNSKEQKTETAENYENSLEYKETEVLNSAGIEILEEENQKEGKMQENRSKEIEQMEKTPEPYVEATTHEIQPEKLELEASPEEKEDIKQHQSIFAKKLSETTNTAPSKTEHISDTPQKPSTPKSYPKGQDPYRLPPI